MMSDHAMDEEITERGLLRFIIGFCFGLSMLGIGLITLIGYLAYRLIR